MQDHAPAGNTALPPQEAADVVLSAEMTASVAGSPTRLAAWASLVHPYLLPLSIGPAVVTLAWLAAHGTRLSLGVAIAGVLAVATAHAGAVVWREYELYLDAGTAADRTRAYSQSLQLDRVAVSPWLALRVASGLLVVSALLGLTLVAAGGPLVLLLGVAGLVLAVAFSARTVRIGDQPYGAVLVALALGPGVMLVTSLAQRQAVNAQFWLLALVIGCFELAAVLALQLQSHDADAAQGRQTLTTLLGDRASMTLATILLIAPYLLVVALGLPLHSAHGILLGWLALPFGLVAATGVARARGAEARALAMRATLRAYMLFVLWATIGLALTPLVVHVISAARGMVK